MYYYLAIDKWQVLGHSDKVKSLPPQHRFCLSMVVCISHPALSPHSALHLPVKMVLPIKSWHLCHYPLNCSAVYFMRTKCSGVDFIPQELYISHETITFFASTSYAKGKGKKTHRLHVHIK